uniref:AP2/ERF domain-containing protein n=1 Tax=Araucaria cunninghamii TaxID=56994 RepID=A0A0D6QVE5_ARACU
MTKPSPKQKAHSSSGNASQKAQQLKGVRMRKWGKWVSEVRIPKSQAKIWLGSHNTPEQAARAYDCAVYCLRGSKAKLNFPEFLPEIPAAPSLSPAEIQAAAAKHAAKDFWQPPKKDAVFSGSESHSSIGGRLVLEERDSTLLYLFL